MVKNDPCDRERSTFRTEGGSGVQFREERKIRDEITLPSERVRGGGEKERTEPHGTPAESPPDTGLSTTSEAGFFGIGGTRAVLSLTKGRRTSPKRCRGGRDDSSNP